MISAERAQRLFWAIASVLLAGFLAACALPSEVNHDNFKSRMQANVGRPLTDPYLSLNRYPERKRGSKALPNGNIEQEYVTGYKWRCRVFWEIDPRANRIVGWRYEGTKEDCSIPI